MMPSIAAGQTASRPFLVVQLAPVAAPVEQVRAVVLPDLARRGFVEGRNMTFTAVVGGVPDLPRLAREIAALKPDVVIASTLNAVRALEAAGGNFPIVMSFIGEDPVAERLAQSFARPGGRFTGLTVQAYQLDGKRLSLLTETMPGVKRIAVLAKRPPSHLDSIAIMQDIAKAQGLTLSVHFAAAPSEFPAAFAEMRDKQAQAVIAAAAPEYVADAEQLARLALQAGLPIIGEAASMARAGFMIGYGPNPVQFRRRTAAFVAAILRGTSAGELPIEQPTEHEFIINLKTAQALGISVAPLFLARADEVIE